VFHHHDVVKDGTPCSAYQKASSPQDEIKGSRGLSRDHCLFFSVAVPSAEAEIFQFVR
jgi:hypothetical protein